MRIEIRDAQGMTLVKSKLFKRYWLENSKGEVKSLRFKSTDEDKMGEFVCLRTDKYKLIYHKHKDEVIASAMLSEMLGVTSIVEKKVYAVYQGQNWDTAAYVLYDANGTRLGCQWDDVETIENGFIPVKLGSKWGFLNEKLELKIECRFDRVDTKFNEFGYAVITNDGKTGLVDRDGNVVMLDRIYRYVTFFTHNRIKIQTNEHNCQAGLIDETGKVLIPVWYDNLSFKSGYIISWKDERKGLYDINGNMLLEPIYPEIMETLDSFVVEDITVKVLPKKKEVAKKLNS